MKVMSPLPRIIHQIWIGPHPRPEAWMKSWSRLNPNWEYRLWIDGNLPPLRNQRAFDEYGNCWSGKADVLRYGLLLRHGGIYVDADTECLRPLDELLAEWPADRDCFAVYENESCMPGLIANGILGTKPNSRLFQRLVDSVSGLAIRGREPAWIITGPGFFTEQARGDDSLWVLPSWTFLPEHHSGIRHKGPERPFARHYWHTTTGARPT